MLEPKDVQIENKTYVLSKFPAVQGREIVAKYPLSGMPKLGDYAVNQETMLKLMTYVGVRTDAGIVVQLSTQDLINNHVKSWENLVKLEWMMLEYNCSFFQKGQVSNFLKDLAQKLPQWITKILMDFSQQSSQQEKPPLTN